MDKKDLVIAGLALATVSLFKKCIDLTLRAKQEMDRANQAEKEFYDYRFYHAAKNL